MVNLSVVIPVYKVIQEHLRACLDSLAAQTMSCCEFIIVSDGASHAECSICEEFVVKDSRFKFFKREHAGVSATRNFGIECAQGEYITFVDADDWINPETCEIVYDYAKENDSDIVLWEAAQDKNGVLNYGFLFNEPVLSLSSNEIDLIISNIIHTTSMRYISASLVCCKLFKKTLIDQNIIRYPEELTISEDRIFNILAYQNSNKMSYLNKVLYYYRIHDQSTSHQYLPDAFEKYSAFVQLLNEDVQTKYCRAISNEIIRVFFLSWSSCYMHKQSPRSFGQRINAIKNISKSKLFRNAISKCDEKKIPTILRFELKCIKFHLFFPIYIHALKAELVNLFRTWT